MSFDRIDPIQAINEVNEVENKLDMRSVIGSDRLRNPLSKAEIAAQLMENERLVAEIKASFVDAFKGLGNHHRVAVVDSFAPHQTGKDYPLYDLLRSTVNA